MTAAAQGEDFRDRVTAVRRRVATACARAGRDPGSVVIIGVAKTHPPEAIRSVAALGITDVAENRVAELVVKQDRIDGVRWHFVGSLQRRKARELIARDVLIHSVDRERLAAELSRRAERAERRQRILVQVNAGQDPAKGGCAPDDALDLVAYARGLPCLSVEGLMTIPPLPEGPVDPAEAARPVFARLRGLRDQARDRWPEVVHLSMGMSADLESAVEEGATMVRIGTALYGPRGDAAWRPADRSIDDRGTEAPGTHDAGTDNSGEAR
jgi:pyridoxal phosphate enzyme (YggS family)